MSVHGPGQTELCTGVRESPFSFPSYGGSPGCSWVMNGSDVPFQFTCPDGIGDGEFPVAFGGFDGNGVLHCGMSSQGDLRWIFEVSFSLAWASGFAGYIKYEADAPYAPGLCPWDFTYSIVLIDDFLFSDPKLGLHFIVSPPTFAVSSVPCPTAEPCWIVCHPCECLGTGIADVLIPCATPLLSDPNNPTVIQDFGTMLCYMVGPETVNDSTGYVVVNNAQVVDDCAACCVPLCFRRMVFCGCPGFGNETLGPIIWVICAGFTPGTVYLIHGTCYTATGDTKSQLVSGDQFVAPGYDFTEYQTCDDCCGVPPPPPPGECPSVCTNCSGTIAVSVSSWTQTINPGCVVVRGSDTVPAVQSSPGACQWGPPSDCDYPGHSVTVICPESSSAPDEQYSAFLACVPGVGWQVHVNVGCTGAAGPGPNYLSPEGGNCPPSGLYFKLPGAAGAGWPPSVFVSA